MQCVKRINSWHAGSGNRPKDYRSLTYYIPSRDKTPETAITAVYPIITGNKKRIFSNCNFRHCFSRMMCYIIFFYFFSIKIDNPVHYLYSISFYCNNSLYIIMILIDRRFKNYYMAMLPLSLPIDDLIAEQCLPVTKRIFHRSTLYYCNLSDTGYDYNT